METDKPDDKVIISPKSPSPHPSSPDSNPETEQFVVDLYIRDQSPSTSQTLLTSKTFTSTKDSHLSSSFYDRVIKYFSDAILHITPYKHMETMSVPWHLDSPKIAYFAITASGSELHYLTYPITKQLRDKAPPLAIKPNADGHLVGKIQLSFNLTITQPTNLDEQLKNKFANLTEKERAAAIHLVDAIVALRSNPLPVTSQRHTHKHSKNKRKRKASASPSPSSSSSSSSTSSKSVASAKTKTEEFLMQSGRSLRYVKNNVGLRTLPCGSPLVHCF